MTLIDGDRIITAHLYDDEYEEFTEKKMSIIDYINACTNEGVTETDVVERTRWIPVSERLPEEDTDVLVTLKCGLIGIMQKKLADDDNGESCYIWQDFEGEEHEVIAWMPLPQAYSEVEEWQTL